MSECESAYLAGWNVPGCLPESEPLQCETEEEAFRYLVERVDAFWDDDASVDPEAADARWLPIHTALHNAPTVPWVEGVPGANLAFWVDTA